MTRPRRLSTTVCAFHLGFGLGDHQAALRRVGRGLRPGAADRSAAGPAHPPRPHPGNERRELPAQAQQGNRRVQSSRRSRGRIGRTVNAVSSCSFNVSTPTNLLPSVITSVVHDHAAPVAQYLGAIDGAKRQIHPYAALLSSSRLGLGGKDGATGQVPSQREP